MIGFVDGDVYERPGQRSTPTEDFTVLVTHLAHLATLSRRVRAFADRLAASLVRSADIVDLIQSLKERFDNLFVPLSSRSILQDRFGLFGRHPFTIGPVAGHRIVGIGHCEDAAIQRDLFAA